MTSSGVGFAFPCCPSGAPRAPTLSPASSFCLTQSAPGSRVFSPTHFLSLLFSKWRGEALSPPVPVQQGLPCGVTVTHTGSGTVQHGPSPPTALPSSGPAADASPALATPGHPLRTQATASGEQQAELNAKLSALKDKLPKPAAASTAPQQPAALPANQQAVAVAATADAAAATAVGPVPAPGGQPAAPADAPPQPAPGRAALPPAAPAGPSASPLPIGVGHAPQRTASPPPASTDVHMGNATLTLLGKHPDDPPSRSASPPPAHRRRPAGGHDVSDAQPN